MKTTIIAVTLLLTAATPAFADNSCLMRREIDGWGARDAHSLVVNDVFGRKYLLSVAGWCQDLDFSLTIGIRSSIGMADMCVERGDRIVLHGPGVMPNSGLCTIMKIERYTPEMEKAYKAALAAKENQHTE